MTLTRLQFRITLLDDGVRFSKGGKSTNVVDDLADNPRNRGNLADDFARGCISSLFDLKQQLAQLKVTQIASLSLTAEMLKPQNSSFLKDDGSWLEAKKLCGDALKKFKKYKSNYDYDYGRMYQQEPQLSQTVLGFDDIFQNTGRKYGKAKIMKAKVDVPDSLIKKDQLYYIDTGHYGTTAQIEVFNKSGKIHQGAMNLEGTDWISGAVDGRSISNLLD